MMKTIDPKPVWLDPIFPPSKAFARKLAQWEEKHGSASLSRLASQKGKAERETRETRKPRFGSQLWAETRGDDLGASPDY